MLKFHNLYFRGLVFFLVFTVFFSCETTDEVEGKKNEPNMIDGQEIIPSQYKTVYIHNIRNRTSEFYISQRLKEKLKTRYLSDGRLQIKNKKEDADIWLYTTIEYYHKTPLHYDRFGRPTEYRLAIAATLRVQKNMKKANENEAPEKKMNEDSVLLPNRTVTAYHMFSPKNFQNERDTQETLLDSVADRIIYTSFNGWYTELKTDQELNYTQYKNQKSLLKNFQNKDDIVIPKDISKEERERLEKEYQHYYYKEE